MTSLITPKELFVKVKELNQNVVQISDYDTLSGSWDCFNIAKDAGIKLIIGCDFTFVDDIKNSSNVRLRHIVLSAKNHIGYKNLLALHREAFDNFIIQFKKAVPIIDWNLLEKYSDGLICTADDILGQLINNKQQNKAKEQAQKLKDIFNDDLAFVIQPNALVRKATSYNDYLDQSMTNRYLIKFGEELNVKIIPATNAHFLTKEQYEAHDVLLAIGSGQPVRSGARLKFNSDFYLKSREEVYNFFSRLYKDKIDTWLDNTLYFAEKCEEPVWIDPKYSRPNKNDLWELPHFLVENQKDYAEFKIWKQTNELVKNKPDDVAYLRYICEIEIIKRNQENKEYRERLEKELNVLEIKNLSSYMLIVADFLNWARENNIPVGAGRGSAGGSYVGYLLNIHEADPIKYELLFERFYNIDKTGVSDIDSDISKAGKGFVEQYISDKYGKEYFAQVSNFSQITPKPYAKFISKTFMYGGDQKSAVAVGAAIAGAIPDDIHSVMEALDKAPLFAAYADQSKYKHLKEYAALIGNKTYNYALHAGAVVIGQRPLAEIVPLRKTKDGDIAIEYNKDQVEANGLVKIDLLGLSTLDIIQDTFNLIKERGKKLPAIPWNYDENDQKTYEMISRGDNHGVFQLGTSGGTIDLCKRVKPKNIEDLAIITALTRPGVSKDVRDEFIQRKDGKKKVELAHPMLKRAFGATFGLGIFDECLMWLAVDIAGWDLNQADRLRKFVKDKGKNPEKSIKLREDFINDTTNNKVNFFTRKQATKIWDEIVANFGAYAFNKCLIGSTILKEGGRNKNSPNYISIKELYDAKNSKTSWGEKIRSGKFQLLQMDEDGRIRPQKVKNIYYNGKREVFKIKTINGKEITGTSNHKLLTNNGYLTIAEMNIGTKLICVGKKEIYIKKGYQSIRAVGKKYNQCGMPTGERNPSWIDGRNVYFNKAKKDVFNRAKEKCEFCSKTDSTRFEFAHIKPLEECNGNYIIYHSENNIKYLCNNCHKQLDYDKGERKKQWSRGLPTEIDEIVSIEFAGIEDVYDIEMNSSNHNFIANDIVSHNSHAITYSFLSYQTAYLKANYPLEFLVANLTYESGSNAQDASDNILAAKKEIRKHKVKILPPNINKSGKTYQIIDDNTLLTGFDSLKFIGSNSIPEILAKRPFKSFDDFLTRIDARKVNSKTIQALVAGGCLDDFGLPRKLMYQYSSDYRKKLQIWNKKQHLETEVFNYPFPNIEDWSPPEAYAMEVFFIGEGLSGNVRSVYPGFFDNRAINLSTLSEKYSDISNNDRISVPGSLGIIEGVISGFYQFKVKNPESKIFGEMMTKIDLTDPYGSSIPITIFPSKLDDFNKRLKQLGKTKLEPGTAIHLSGTLNWFDGSLSLIFDDLKKAAPKPAMPTDLEHKSVKMKITGKKNKNIIENSIEDIIEEYEDVITESGLEELDNDMIEELLEID